MSFLRTAVHLDRSEKTNLEHRDGAGAVDEMELEQRDPSEAALAAAANDDTEEIAMFRRRFGAGLNDSQLPVVRPKLSPAIADILRRSKPHG